MKCCVCKRHVNKKRERTCYCVWRINGKTVYRSWCGDCQDNRGADVDTMYNAMNKREEASNARLRKRQEEWARQGYAPPLVD